jgi:protein TonB
VIPLLATDVMPDPFETIGAVTLVEPVVPPPPPLPPKQREITPVEPPPNAEAAPIEAPDGFTPEKPIEPRWEDGVVPAGVVVGVTDPNAIIAPPPPPPVEQKPLRVGGTIRRPQKIRDVAPAYPAIAQSARIQGIVIIEATIGADGQVVNAQILRSVPLLDEAALDAVRQWQYTPTLLNGVPVPVIMTVTVQFTLSK